MMSKLPRISIITPSFNQGHFIEETIASVLSQDYPDLEYIVMDGGSSDDTAEILKKYGDNLTWRSEKDRGQTHAINKWLKIATGDVIAYLNSDDLYNPGALLVGKFFAENPNNYWATGKCRIIDPEGMEIRKLITLYKNFWLHLNSYKALLVLDYVSQPATFWHRQVIEKVGQFDESLHLTMDYDYSLRVGHHYKLWFIDAYLASFRSHPDSKSTTSTKVHFDSDLVIAKCHTSSPILRSLHAAHNRMIVFLYQQMRSKI